MSNVSGSTTAVTRTIQKVKNHPLYRGQSGNYSYDIQICLLDSDLPSDVDIMETLPSNQQDYTGQYGWISTANVVFDQEQKGTTRMLALTPGRGSYDGTILPTHWFNTCNSTLMEYGISYEPGPLGYSTTSDHFSTRQVPTTDKLYLLNENIIVGDSGAPNCFVLGSKLILIGLNTSSSGGIFVPNLISDINQLIIDVDTLAGISTGYALTECNLSIYPTY